MKASDKRHVKGEKVQCHVQVNPDFYKRFKEALKRKSEFTTVSEWVRSQMRRFLEEEKAIRELVAPHSLDTTSERRTSI